MVNNIFRKLVRFSIALTTFPFIFMLLVGCIVLVMDWILDCPDEYPTIMNETKYSDTLRRMRKIFNTWVLWITFERVTISSR